MVMAAAITTFASLASGTHQTASESEPQQQEEWRAAGTSDQAVAGGGAAPFPRKKNTSYTSST